MEPVRLAFTDYFAPLVSCAPEDLDLWFCQRNFAQNEQCAVGYDSGKTLLEPTEIVVRRYSALAVCAKSRQQTKTDMEIILFPIGTVKFFFLFIYTFILSTGYHSG